MSLTIKLVMSGILLIYVIVTGMWVSRLGRPISTGVFTIHKLTALAFAVFASIVFINLLKENQIDSVIPVVLIIAGLSIAALFASGVFLSFEKPLPKIILNIHAFTPIITVISSALAIYVLIN